MNKIALLSIPFCVILLFACNNEDLSPEILGSSIESNHKRQELYIPYADSVELKELAQNKKVLDFELARKITLLEMNETGFVQDMAWNGYHLAPNPVVIYNLESWPKFYDFIAFDSENNAIGTIRVNANRKNSSVINGVYSSVFDYNEFLTKSNASNPSIFMDWKGEQFVGVRSKAGKAPKQIISVDNGTPVLMENMRELEGEEIIQHMETHILPTLIPDQRAFEKVPDYMVAEEELNKEIEYGKNMTVEALKDSMEVSLARTEEEAKAYWNTLSAYEQELLETSDEELNNEGKFFGRLFRRIFSRTDESLKWIDKYDDRKYSYRRGGACGPWVCGYILYVNQGKDKYDFFYNNASSFGEFGILNFALRLFGRPMTPGEMGWTMPIASNGKIWINPALCFADLFAYDQIKHYKKPAIRLCGSGGQLHWTLAYGAKQTGSWFWRNYYFLQIDNGAKVGVPGDKKNGGNYTKVDWWNPWLMVWD